MANSTKPLRRSVGEMARMNEWRIGCLKGLGLLSDLDDVRRLIRQEFGTGRCEPEGDSASFEPLWQQFLRVSV